jgi:hypothetical protein
VTLLVFEHELRVGSPEEAAALFRALGSHRVSTKGWIGRDRATIDRLLDALAPRDGDTVTFTAGTLDDASAAALRALADAGPGFVHLRDPAWTDLSMWRDRASVAARDGSGGEFAGGGAANHAAIARYRELAAPRVETGYVLHMSAPAKLALPAFLHALGAQVTALVELEPAAAAELATFVPYGELEWRDDMTVVRLPSGTITKYATRANERRVPKWKQAVARAMTKLRRD